MELRRTETGFALYKEKEVIGHCTLHPAAQGAALAALAIDPAWRRKGYGSYLLKEVLRSFGGYDREAATVFTAPLPADCAEMAFWAKFGFAAEGPQLVRRRTPDLTAVKFVQDFLAARLVHPRLCVDATCGNGGDTAFLCRLTAPEGRVLGFDIQPEAIASTRARLEQAKVPAGQYALHCDSHAHLDGEEFDADREEVLARARAAGVATIGNIFLDPDRWRRRRGYFDAHPEVFFVLGIHPCDGQQCTPEVLADIREAFAVDDRLRAVGEIGLDFYWDDCPKEIQYQVLHDQLQLARELEKPVVIHCRNAEAETLMTLEARGFVGYPLLWHCFGGDADMARRIIRNGWHISIPGPVSYPANKAVREALAVIPDDRLLLETDSPYLSPVPLRGNRNEPAFTVFTVRHMAAARGMEPEELWQLCGDNARRFFGV